MFATSVTRPPHELLGLAHILTAVPIDGLADCFRCKEAAQLRRVAVDFAFNSLLKDKVSPEARQWEKRRDEKEIANKQMARLVTTTKLFASFAIREKIKYKSIDEAEALLKEVAKDIEHIELYTPPN